MRYALKSFIIEAKPTPIHHQAFLAGGVSRFLMKLSVRNSAISIPRKDFAKAEAALRGFP
jgi:hypothetical protein